MSLQRYFITLSYDGTRYHGWQIQPNGLSVEECLRKALTTLLRQPIEHAATHAACSRFRRL